MLGHSVQINSKIELLLFIYSILNGMMIYFGSMQKYFLTASQGNVLIDRVIPKRAVAYISATVGSW